MPRKPKGKPTKKFVRKNGRETEPDPHRDVDASVSNADRIDKNEQIVDPIPNQSKRKRRHSRRENHAVLEQPGTSKDTNAGEERRQKRSRSLEARDHNGADGSRPSSQETRASFIEGNHMIEMSVDADEENQFLNEHHVTNDDSDVEEMEIEQERSFPGNQDATVARDKNS